MQITMKGISKRYAPEGTLRSAHDEPMALDSVSLTIKDGETMSLVGPSGCGKSSLLRVIAGLERPDKGQVWYDDHDVSEVLPQDRGIGMVFQDYALYPTMKGKGNLAYFFEVRKRTEEEAEARAREVAAVMGVGFELLLGQLPTTLSGGEKQRVAIARCIVRDPTLFLMDEPICNLDAKLRESTRMEIKKLLRRFGITTAFVTHDQQEALFMGDRITVLRAGRVEQVGTFDELYYEPANLFVASFIGSRPLAVLPVEIDGREVHADQVVWQLPPHLADSLTPGRMRMGVRPEGWQVGDGTGARMAVDRFEEVPTEQLRLAHGTVAGTKATVVVPRAGPDGAEVSVTPNWDSAIFFAATDESIVRAPGVPDFF